MKARNITIVSLLAITISGCAGASGISPSGAIRDEALGTEVSTSSTNSVDSAATQGKALRRTAGVIEAGVHYGRTVYIDPINRPVSNLLSLSSLVFKSARGMFRRTAINTVQYPNLAGQPIPEVAYRDGMDLEQWERDLDRITGTKASKGRLKFLIDGEAYFDRLYEAFGEAEDSIDIRTYIFDNDDYAVQLGDYLKLRSKDVRVRVMVDGIGNLLAQQSDADSMPAEHKAPLSMSAYLETDSDVSVRTLTNPWFTGDHTKTTIIDSELAFVGGMNIGREYRYDWHDLMMEVEGPIVDQLQHDSDKAWAKASVLGDVANFFRFLVGRKRQAEDVGYPVRALYTRSFDSQIYRAQLAAIRRSQSHILIQNAYFSDDTILYELAKARRRGVDVRVILPMSGNHGPLNASNKVAINQMLENGIRVYLYPGMSHIKAAIYDGWACIGSANFDKLSLEVNKELNLSTSDRTAVTDLLEQVFLPDMAVSEEVSGKYEVTITTRLMEVAVDELL